MKITHWLLCWWLLTASQTLLHLGLPASCVGGSVVVLNVHLRTQCPHVSDLGAGRDVTRLLFPSPSGSTSWRYHHDHRPCPAWQGDLPCGCLREVPGSGWPQGLLWLRPPCGDPLVGTQGNSAGWNPKRRTSALFGRGAIWWEPAGGGLMLSCGVEHPSHHHPNSSKCQKKKHLWFYKGGRPVLLNLKSQFSRALTTGRSACPDALHKVPLI